jgi:signal transduction histidine kinase
LPSPWKNYTVDNRLLPATGYGTYRIVVKLPKDTPNDFAIVTNRIKIAHSVFANGKRVGGDGNPSTTKTGTQSSSTYKISRISNLNTNELEIIIHVSNFIYPRGGMDEIPFIGDYDRITNENNQRLVLSAFIGGAFFLIGLYHLALWYRRRVELPSLVFSLFCLTGAIRVFVSGDKGILLFIHPIPSEILLSLDFWSVFTAIPIMHFYVQLLFPTIFHKKYIYPTAIMWTILMLVCVFGTLTIKAQVVPIFEIYVAYVFVHILYVGIKAVRNKVESSILFTTVFIIVILTGINDILLERAAISTVFLFHWGILIFTFAQAVVLSHRFTNVFVELEQLNLSLEKQVADRTKELSDSKAISDTLHKQTKLLSGRLNEILEKERKQIAMSLHDSLGASLIGFRMKLTAIKNRLIKNTNLPDDMDNAFQSMIDEINLIYNNTRLMVRNLRPELIDVFGLKAALESLIAENNGNNNDRKIYLNVEGSIDKLDENCGISIFRICQEAITNVIKYAHATEMFIVITGEEKALTLSIHDNGIGFDPSQNIGIGLIGMREKAEDLRGTFEIESHIGEGTTITIEMHTMYWCQKNCRITAHLTSTFLHIHW